MVSLTTYVSVLTVGYSRSGGEVRFPYSWGLVPDGYAKTQANILDTSLSWSLLPPLLPSRHGGWWFAMHVPPQLNYSCRHSAPLFGVPLSDRQENDQTDQFTLCYNPCMEFCTLLHFARQSGWGPLA